MSIETEINRISANVSDTLSAVSEMGGEVPEGATSDDMASGVRSIPVGAKIDDTTPSSTTTYSSQKIESELSALNQANAAQNTEIAKKANDADLARVAKSGNYNDLSNKPTIPTVPSALPNPNKLKLSGAVTAEYDGSSEVRVEIPAGGSAYELPIASPAQLGGVKPVAATDEMTQDVGVTSDGRLKAPAVAAPSDEQIKTAVDAFLTEHPVNEVYDEYTVIAEGGEQFVGFSFSELGLSDHFDASMIEIHGHNLGYQSETLTNNQKALIKVNSGTYSYGPICTTHSSCISTSTSNSRNSFLLAFIPGLNKDSGLCLYRVSSIDEITSTPGYSDGCAHLPLNGSYASGFYVCPVSTGSDARWLAGSTFVIRVWR